MGEFFEMQEIRHRCYPHDVRANFRFRRILRKRCRRDGEIEQQIDSKTCRRVEEVDASGSVQANAANRYTTIGDGGGHFSDVVEAGDQFESVVVQDLDDGIDVLARMGDNEVEIARDPLRPKDHQRHAAHQDRFETCAGQRPDDSSNRFKVGTAAVHIMARRDRCPESVP